MKRALFAMLAERALRMATTLCVTVLVARHLGPEAFGLLSAGLAVVALAGPFAVLGLEQICVRELVVHPARRGRLLGTTMVLQLVGGAIAAVACLAAGALLAQQLPGLWPYLAILALTLLLQWPAAGEYALRASGRNPLIALGRGAATLSYLGVAALLLWSGAPPLAFAWLAVVDLALLGTAQALFLAASGAAGRLRFRRATATALLRDAWPLVASGIAIMIYMRIDQIMLAAMIDERAVGLYTAATRVSEAWYVLPMTVAYVLGPALLKRGAAGSAAYRLALHAGTRWLVGVSYLAAVVVTLGAGGIMTGLYGESYGPAAPVLALHFWSGVFVALGVMQSLWLVAANLTRLSLYRTLLGAAVNLALNALLIPRYGALGAAWATLVAQACATTFSNLLWRETRPFIGLQLRALTLRPAAALDAGRGD